MNVYEIVTDRILSLLKSGVIPWRKPWNGAAGPSAPRNLVSGKPYRGINIFLLSASAFLSPFFLTFKQAKERGGSVRKGEHGTPVVFWKILEEEEREGESGKRRRKVPLLRYYTVFNAAQCEGIKVPAVETPAPFSPIEAAERVVREIRAPAPAIHHDGGDSAFYLPGPDSVHMPARESFDRPESYYSTLFHELLHSTGHKDRLHRSDLALYNGRDGSRPREELTAEMGAAFLCGRVGIDQGTVENSAAYIASWLRNLQGDPRMVIQAAGAAQKGADWILGEGRKEEEEEEQA